MGNNKNIKSLMRKADRAAKRKNKTKKEKEFAPLSYDEQIKKNTRNIIIGSVVITGVLFSINLLDIKKYDPSIENIIDTSRVDNINRFLATESVDDYLDVIELHNDEATSDELDIQNVYSSIGREYPFATILNKSQDNTTTMLCKFIYTELKPAVLSYHEANGVYPLAINNDKYSDDLIIDLRLLEDVLNIRDKNIENFKYILTENKGSIKITVKKGDEEVPIIIFKPTSFTAKEINKNEVNLVYDNYSLILRPMEEFNNIRLQQIYISKSGRKSCVIVDTTTNKSHTIVAKQ